MGLTRAHHNHSRFDLSISCAIRLLRKQGALLRCSHDVCMSLPSRRPSIRSSLTCIVLQHLASPASHSMHPSFGIDREGAVAGSCAYTIRCWLDGIPLGHRIFFARLDNLGRFYSGLSTSLRSVMGDFIFYFSVESTRKRT